MPSSPSKPTFYPDWIGVAIAFYAFIAIGIAEGGLGVLLPSILATYNLTPATVTLLFLSQVSGYIVAALTSSLLSNSIGLARVLLVASITLTSALVIYALTDHWFVMVASGTLLGLSIGLIDAGINTYIANKQRNASLMGILRTGLAIHLPGLCWGRGADGCRHALGSYAQIQANDRASDSARYACWRKSTSSA